MRRDVAKDRRGRLLGLAVYTIAYKESGYISQNHLRLASHGYIQRKGLGSEDLATPMQRLEIRAVKAI